MEISSERFLEQLRQAQTVTPERLPKNFPFGEFQTNLTKYNEQDDWYNGTALDEEMTINGKSVPKYPVHINPIKGTCLRHTAMLFGDISDSDQVLVTPRVVVDAKASDTEKNLSDELEKTLLQVWFENNGRDLQLSNGMMSQRYGGCLFYAKYDPLALEKSIPIAIEAPSPKFFVGVPNSSNPFELEEAWIVKPISRIELENQNIISIEATGIFGTKAWSDELHWLTEHYTKKTFNVYVDNHLVGRRMMLSDGKITTIPFGPDNNLGIVPIVYIPHIRNATSFYGDNVFDNVRGLVLEMNARVADYGDAVSADSHDVVATRNINGDIEKSQLVPGVMRVDLGASINVTGQEAQPDAFSLRRGTMASSAMETLVTDVLYKQYRRDAIHPAVCDGEDEGSQRSSQTLTTRMWALETHAQMERIEWTAGLNRLSKIIIKILMINAPNIGINEKHSVLRIRQVWYPTLKRDRQDIVTEVATRVGANLSSIEHGLELMGDVENIEEELKKIYENKKKLAEMEPKNPFGNEEGGFKNNKVKSADTLAEPKKLRPSTNKEE